MRVISCNLLKSLSFNMLYINLLYRGYIYKKWFEETKASGISAEYRTTGHRRMGRRGQVGIVGDQTIR